MYAIIVKHEIDRLVTLFLNFARFFIGLTAETLFVNKLEKLAGNSNIQVGNT